MEPARRVKKTVSKLLAAVTIYVILILAWFISWLTIGDSNWWLILVNRVAHYLFVPIPLFLIWGIFSRSLKSAIALSIPCLVFVWIYHPYLFPRLSQPRQDNSQLKVMTYNVLFSNNDYDAVANVILTYQPDLVAMQEVKPEMMDGLRERLGNAYPYSLVGTKNTFGTTAVFSRYPLVDSYVLDLQTDRPATIIETNINGQGVTFAAVHLLAYGLQWVGVKNIPKAVVQRTSDQNRQVEILLDELEKEAGIVIVGCDCNSYETSSSYRIFGESMNNAARKVGWLLGTSQFENTIPDADIRHIDYIWYRGALSPTAVYKIKDSGGSDHLPVLATFTLGE